MRFWRNLRTVIHKLDFFYTAEVLRYKEQPEYRTIFGGILSISIITLLLVTFYNKIIDTFGKVIISSSTSAVNANNPTPYNISTMPGQPFMLGVEIWHHNLNTNPRYFDVALTSVIYDNGMPNASKSVRIPLQACTRQHWSRYPRIQQNYDRLNINYWLCLPKDSEFEIYGKYSSITSKTLEVSVSRCTNSSDFTYPCASDAEIDQLFQDEKNFYYTAYFINPLINADSQQYLSYYLEDSNYVIFSATAGEECQLWMQDYTITTDESIIPFESYDVKTGGIVTKNCIKNRYTIDPTDPSPLYSTISFFKSPISKNIQRSYQKIDEILSYIGGLFGTLTICLFMVNIYNSYSFEIAMGSYLFKPSDAKQQKQLKSYNFFYFIMQLIYAFFNVFNCRLNWKSAKLYYECREEMIKQLDVLYLYRRVAFLQRAIGTLFTQQQIKALHLYQRCTLAEAEKVRKKHKMNRDFFIFRIAEIAHQSEQAQSPIKEEIHLHGKFTSQKSQEVNIVSCEQIEHKIKNISFQGSRTSDIALRKPEPAVDEYQESSDSEEEDEEDKKAEVNHTLKQLAVLSQQAQRSRLSRRIWSNLQNKIKKFVVDLAVEQKPGGQFMQKYDDAQFLKMQEGSSEMLNRQPEKPLSLKKITLLPKQSFSEQVKMSRNEESYNQPVPHNFKDESLVQFVEFQDFNIDNNHFEEL